MGVAMFGERFTLSVETEIAAPAAAVWEILTDFDAFPQWNPYLVEIRGAAGTGAKLDLVLSLPGGRERRREALVHRCVEGQQLCWRRKFLFSFIFQAEHQFRLLPLDPRCTRFTHTVVSTGWAVPYQTHLRAKTQAAIMGMNRALKARAEQC